MYNENEVRKILKNNELTERDKKKRYKALYALPSFIVLLLLLSENFNYIFISFVVVGFIIIELIIFGLMDNKYHYALSDFLKDGVYLLLTSLIITYLAAPVLVAILTDAMNVSHRALNGLRFIVSMLLLYASWFSIVKAQSKIRKKSEKWKWDVTGLFSNEKKKLDEI